MPRVTVIPSLAAAALREREAHPFTAWLVLRAHLGGGNLIGHDEAVQAIAAARAVGRRRARRLLEQGERVYWSSEATNGGLRLRVWGVARIGDHLGAYPEGRAQTIDLGDLKT